MKNGRSPHLFRPRLFQSGFSLIELIMIIALIGILAAIVAPKLLQTNVFSLDGASAMITADIRHAQELAMSTHDDKDVVFTQNSSSYTVETKDDGVDKTVDLPSWTTITSASVTFTFNPLGEPTVGGGSSVTISAGGSSKTITVESYTGRVTVS